MSVISIAGAGPAGSSAAIAARLSGAEVHLYDPARFPRHKVCGEFLSPGAPALLERLGVWDRILALGPARQTRLGVHFPRTRKQCRLPEMGWGVSRYALDRILLERALELGAVFHSERATAPTIVATGRHPSSATRPRLFGFKAHFSGPLSDSVDLYFSSRTYVGVNVVENGVTNVCGLAPEDVLARSHFDPDPLLSTDSLRARLRNHHRLMDWLITGPIVCDSRTRVCSPLVAGDALSFVDPFTGTGILNAILTGWLAGSASARGLSPESYEKACSSALELCFQSAALIRSALASGWAEFLLPFVPGSLLVRATRPKIRLNQ
ncbi:MAG: hypothetical protein JNN08_23260 [Bryobacterales bacterium]|nr:hypothetical protein [Bryobacterales bacterium]